MKDTYPNLEWVRTRSANPRDLHLQYAGLVLPVNDPFWLNNTPGSLYGCKCDWRLSNAIASPLKPEEVKPSKGLQGNPGISRELFSPDHTYLAYRANAAQVDELARKYVLSHFETLKTFKTGKVMVHPMHDRTVSDFEDLQKISIIKAKEGNTVYIMPNVHGDASLYEYIFRGSIKNKCPDLMIGAEFIEYEGYINWSGNSIDNMIAHGFKQSDKLIIKLPNEFDLHKVLYKIKRHNKPIKSLAAFQNGELKNIYP
jgi:hypothetical protein